jgi:fluoride ion exporter CrcB/FEX
MLPGALDARDLGRVALGGALGTVVRMLLASGAAALLVVNVLGAAGLGALSGHLGPPGAMASAGAAAAERHRRLSALVATGFLGGLTTFSTMVVVAGRLGHDAGLVAPGSGRMTGAGLALAAAYLAASVIAGLIVFVAARRIAGGLTRRAALRRDGHGDGGDGHGGDDGAGDGGGVR